MVRDNYTGFKVDFNILDYADILPMPPDNMEDIINYDKPSEDCVWERIVPDIITKEYIEQEVTRILRTGVWIYIHKQLVWLPPAYYFFLQYFLLTGEPAEFRLKRLKHVYFKLRVRDNPKAIGTYTMKNRQDGETSYSVSEALWEVADGNMEYGAIAMQSKTRDTVMNSCWRTFIMGYNGLPKWLKDSLYRDIQSDDKLATKMKFVRPASDIDEGRDVLVTYGASTHNAFDSMNNMRRCILDEVNKWEECSFYSTFLNYEKFIAPGMSRKGLFDIFSSPSDTVGSHSDEALAFWKGSDPDKLTDYGSTETRVYRYYSNPLEGIEKMYDKYGDADADEIKAWILRRRASLPKDKQMGEIRAYPLNENEMFGAFEGGNMWDNVQGIKDRVVFLIGRRFKDDKTKEPIKIFGNLERVDGYIDGEVEFRASDKDHFDVRDARFCISYFPNREVQQPLKDIFRPPAYIERVIGLDPFNNKYEAKNKVRQSKAAMVCRQFRDLYGTGVLNVPTGIYLNRPQDIEIVFEDALRFAIWNRALIQVESRSDKMAVYAEERGYSDWLLTEIGSTDPRRKGDSPGGGKNRFLNEGIGLINANTNLPNPLRPEQPYWLEKHWFSELLEDYLVFNPLDTHENDLSMADIQALVGGVKIMHKRIKKPSQLTTEVMDYLFN